MARSIHLFVVVSGFAMLAEGFVAFFYRPGWMVQQGAITPRGLLVAILFGLGVTSMDLVVQCIRSWVRDRAPSEMAAVTHLTPSATVGALDEDAQPEGLEPPLAA